MQRTLFFLSLVVAVFLGSPRAQAQPGGWDSRGWVMLGERTVNGRFDKDKIDVGRYEGRFTKLTVVVEDSDLEMIDMRVQFADRTEFHPQVAQVFRRDTRTRVIDMPPGESIIRNIEFKYKNLGGDRRNARVQVWGLKSAPPPPPRYQWDTNGWQMLGEQTVDGMRHVDNDRINVGAYEGRFSKLQVVVDDSDMEMFDLRIEFADRTEYHPKVQQFFKEGARTRVIDLPPGEQLIRYIDFKYRNLPGDRQRARVQVWGFKMAPARVWDERGWTMLGERIVDGHRKADRDTIEVGRGEGKFSRLTVVVLDADMEMIEMVVHFRHDDFRPAIAQFFRNNTRTKVIDLPGDHDRTIQSIDFKYRNVPGEGHARVQVWAR